MKWEWEIASANLLNEITVLAKEGCSTSEVSPHLTITGMQLSSVALYSEGNS